VNACYTINKKRGYLRVRTTLATYDYPLDLASELKTQNNHTWQELANHLAKLQDEQVKEMDT
jgi:hypothetical protein